MDQDCFQLMRFFCQHTRSHAINRFGQFRFTLGFIHGSISRCIDDHLWPDFPHGLANAGRICQIHFRVIVRDHNTKWLQGALQFPAKLASIA